MDRLRAIACIASLACLAACGGRSSSPAPSAVPGLPAEVIGTWTSDVTKDDLRAKGVTDEHLLNENSGRYRWTFGADGTWTIVQESLDGSPVFNPVVRGTWTGTPGALVVTTTFPSQLADHGVTITWRIEDGRLVLRVPDPPDDLYALNAEMHPWVRAGA